MLRKALTGIKTSIEEDHNLPSREVCALPVDTDQCNLPELGRASISNTSSQGLITAQRHIAGIMATRRIVASEKTILEKDDTVGSSPPAGETTSVAPAVPT